MILLFIGISTEPTLFHVGCRFRLHVGILQCLYMTLSQNGQHSHMTMRGTHPTPCQKGTSLTFTGMIGHNYYHLWKGMTLTSTSMVGHTYYHLWKGSTLTSISMMGHNYYHLWKGSALTSTSMIGHNYYHLWKGTALTCDHVGTNPTVTSEWISSLGREFLIND